MIKKQSKCLIFVRVSTDEKENKQELDNQINICKRYAESNGWDYEIVKERHSAYNGKQRKVYDDTLEKLRLKEFNILMVYMLDRWSRSTPTAVVSDLHKIVDSYGVRFISIKESIDSNNEMWEIIMMIFAYMANNYSKMLGIRVKEGIALKRKKNPKIHWGRPKVKTDVDYIKMLRDKKRMSWKQIYNEINKDKPKKKVISIPTIRRRYSFKGVVKSPT